MIYQEKYDVYADVGGPTEVYGVMGPIEVTVYHGGRVTSCEACEPNFGRAAIAWPRVRSMSDTNVLVQETVGELLGRGPFDDVGLTFGRAA